MRNDTTYISGFHFTIADVYAMPKKGVQIDYINNCYQITMSGGHVHWYWVKSGWIFRVGAAGYAALNVVNGIIQNNFSFTGSHLGISIENNRLKLINLCASAATLSDFILEHNIHDRMIMYICSSTFTF